MTHLHISVPAITRGTLARTHELKNDALSYRIFLITRECVTNTMFLITSISKKNLQTTVITVISFRQIPGYSIDSRFGIRGCVTIEQRKMLFSF